MGKSQIIHTDGEDLVVITRSDYESLLARAGDEASEDAMTARIVEASDAKIARGKDVALPAAVWDAIENGEHPIRAIRKYRGLTQAGAAEQAGLQRGRIADIEAGKKKGSARTRAAASEWIIRDDVSECGAMTVSDFHAKTTR